MPVLAGSLLLEVPGRVVGIRTVADVDHHRPRFCQGQQPFGQRQRCRVRPVKVVERDDEWMGGRDLAEELGENLEGPVLERLGRQRRQVRGRVRFEVEPEHGPQIWIDLLGAAGKRFLRLTSELYPDPYLRFSGADLQPVSKEVPVWPVGQ